jgi:hypothetical protein
MAIVCDSAPRAIFVCTTYLVLSPFIGSIQSAGTQKRHLSQASRACTFNSLDLAATGACKHVYLTLEPKRVLYSGPHSEAITNTWNGTAPCNYPYPYPSCQCFTVSLPRASRMSGAFSSRGGYAVPSPSGPTWFQVSTALLNMTTQGRPLLPRSTQRTHEISASWRPIYSITPGSGELARGLGCQHRHLTQDSRLPYSNKRVQSRCMNRGWPEVRLQRA